jgi:hypothetical protein
MAKTSLSLSPSEVALEILEGTFVIVWNFVVQMGVPTNRDGEHSVRLHCQKYLEI